MKKGYPSLTALAQEVERRIEAKKDLVASVKKIEMDPEFSDGPHLVVAGEDFPINQIAHNDLAEYLKIHRDYYNRMLREEPVLLAQNVNTWLPKKTAQDRGGKNERPDHRLVRTLDGRVRALLSKGYRLLENEDLLQAVVPVLRDMDLEIISCDLTERRMYLKAVSRDLQAQIPIGHHMGDGTHTIFKTDRVNPIICFSNSEVGDGSWCIEGGTFTHGCTNLAIFDAKMRKYHTGARADVTQEVYELLTDETKQLTDQAVISQTKDLVRAVFDKAKFEERVEQLKGATGDRIEDDVVKVVERVAKKYSFTEATRSNVLKHFVESADLSRYGLHGAITRASADEGDYDFATKMERIGGDVIELPRSEWKELAKAA